MIKMVYFINIILVLFLSCTTHGDAGAKGSVLDTIPKEIKIPYRDIATDTGQVLLQKTAKYMGLPSMAGGSRGLSVRIWLWEVHSESELNHVYYIVNINAEKMGHRCSVVEWTGRRGASDTNVYILTIKRRWSDLQPRSGWDNFDSTLLKYQIPSLANGMSSKDMPDNITPASYVDFEIAQPSEYRFYKYLEPSFCRYIDEGSNDVYQFLKYFNKEMNVDVYHPVDSLYIDGKNRKQQSR